MITLEIFNLEMGRINFLIMFITLENVSMRPNFYCKLYLIAERFVCTHFQRVETLWCSNITRGYSKCAHAAFTLAVHLPGTRV